MYYFYPDFDPTERYDARLEHEILRAQIIEMHAYKNGRNDMDYRELIKEEVFMIEGGAVDGDVDNNDNEE